MPLSFRLKNMHGFYWHYKEVEKATRYHRMYITSRVRNSQHDDSSKSTPVYWIDQLESKLSDHGQQLDLDELLRELIEYPKTNLPTNDPIRARYFGNLGRVLAHYRRYNQAKESFTECLDAHRVLGSDPGDTEWVSQELAKLYAPANPNAPDPVK